MHMNTSVYVFWLGLGPLTLVIRVTNHKHLGVCAPARPKTCQKSYGWGSLLAWVFKELIMNHNVPGSSLAFLISLSPHSLSSFYRVSLTME